MENLTYSRNNGYRVPNLRMDEDGMQAEQLGRFGQMREKYLMEHRQGLYQSMLLTGRLWTHLTETDRQAEDMMEHLTQEMAASMGVNEAMKAADQLEWVRRMNTIRHSAEESVLNDLIFS